MSECCLIKKVATVEVYENKNEVRAYGFMTGDRNTPVMEVKFRHLWGEENLSKCKLRWIIVDDVGSLLVGEVPISEDNKALIELPNQLFTGERRMKVQLTVASCDGARILNLQQFTDLKVINNLATNEVVEPVYQMLINQVYDDTKKYLAELETSYKAKYGSLESVYAKSKASLEQYLITAENGGNAEFLQGYNPKNFNRVENTINELVNSASSKYKVGDVVEVLGFYAKGDGSHHKRIAKSEDDGSGEQGQGGIWWCVAKGVGRIKAEWLGTENITVQKIKSLIDKGFKFESNKLFTINDMWNEWSSKQYSPIAFLGDSTTDGATTTGHTPSIPTADGVQINESPNAYSKILEDTIKRAIPGYPSENRVIFNAGFDSQSMANNFGIDKFDSIFTQTDSVFKDAKMIGFAWGVTDIINNGNPVNAMKTYRLNLETCIVYSLMKGKQPFLCNPVPMWVPGNLQRNGWQLLSIINEVNEDLAIKYNLEILSLRDGMEVDMNKTGDNLKYFAPDLVHPNDKGHSAIAGGLFKQMCPNVFETDEIVVAGHSKIMKASYGAGKIDKTQLLVDYNYFFQSGTYRFFVWSDYNGWIISDTYNLDKKSTTTPNGYLTNTSFNEKESYTGNIFSGTYDCNFGKLTLHKSRERVVEIKRGLNEVILNVATDFGSLKFEEESDNVKTTSLGNSILKQENFYNNLECMAGSHKTFSNDTSSYYICKGTSTFSINGFFENLENTELLFNISKDGKFYNFLKFTNTILEFGYVNTSGRTVTATSDGIQVGGLDFRQFLAQYDSKVWLNVNIGSNVTDIDSTDTISVKIMNSKVYNDIVATSEVLKNTKQGFGIGIRDASEVATIKRFSSIKVITSK